MGRIRFLFAEEVKKTVCSLRFFVLVLLVFGLCLFIPFPSPVGTDTNCLNLLFSIPQDGVVLDRGEFAFLYIMGQLRTGYFGMLAPLVTGLAVLPILCEERESGLFRFLLLRCGKKRTVVGKLLASLFCGGLVVMAGYVLAGILMFFSFPHDKAALESGIMSAGWIPSSVMRLPVLAATAAAFLELACGILFYGMVCALWTFLLSAAVQNRYLLSCIPYMGIWFASRLLDAAFMATEGKNRLVLFMIRLVPESVMSVFYDSGEAVFQAVFYLVFAVLAVWIQLMALKGRKDCGT